MSTLQEFILGKIQLGKNPILIVSLEQNDRDYLSLLLSNHLQSPYDSPDRPLTVYDNFFSTSSFRNVIDHHIEKKNKDISTILKLVIEEGFDTKRLYGISIPVSVLLQLDIDRDFATSQILFIYNEFTLQNEKLPVNNTALKSFIQNFEQKIIFVNSKHLFANPTKLAKQLALQFQTTIVQSERIMPISGLTDERFFSTKNKALELSLKNDCIKKDFLQNKYGAHQFLCIFNATSFALKEQLIQKLKFLLCIFPENIQCHLICQSIMDVEAFAGFLTDLGTAKELIKLHANEGLWCETMHKLVGESDADFIYYDNLSLQYSVTDLFEIIQNEKANLCYPATSVSESNKNISLIDLLSNAIPEDAFIIRRNIWNEVGQLDMTLHSQYALWDFFIRAVNQFNQVPVAIPGFALPRTSTELSTAQKESALAGYHQVINKHRGLIEASLFEIINLISDEQQIEHLNRRELQEKISSLQNILLHSKEELKSFQQLTSQLQQRIGYLENNWYQKLKIKVVRIKKIFFKKNSPGSGSLKRILLFIRFSMSKAGFGILRKIVKNIFKKLFLLAEKRPVKIVYLDEIYQDGVYTYHDWIKQKLDSKNLQAYYAEKMDLLKLNPKISIIMPVYNAPLKYLKEAIESVLQQNYSNWELCIADDLSSDSKVRKMLHTYSVKDARIKVKYRETNGHISAASNSALELVSGEYILLMDHDDLLSENCLWEVALAINQNPSCEIIYSDEDKIDEKGMHQDAHFKPDWAPDHLLSRNYIGHVSVLKKSLMDTIQGFRLGFEGSQDYDLLLRATELSNEIVHIPKVLYHWRIHTLSAAQSEEVKPYAYIAAKKALSEAISRRGLEGDVKYLSGLRGYMIRYSIKKMDKVSIIIPTKDQTELLKNTIDSIIEKTSYTNYEIIILNNNSSSSQLADFLRNYTAKYPDIIKCVEAHFPFNFSKLMNIGASHASGKYLLLLNNDVEVIHHDWLSVMVSYAQQDRIGAVGVKLLYPDDTIQHAGVVVGLGGIAGHSFVGAYKDEAGYFNYIQSVNNYSAVTAACLMVRRSAFDAVKGMDEQFEVEYNDVDFCLSLMDAGYNNVYLPQVELYHYESATRGHPHQSKPSYERHLKEMKLFKEKWQKYIDHDPFYNPNLNLGVHNFSMNFNA